MGILLNPEFRPGRITDPGIPVPGNIVPDEVWLRAKKLVDAGAGHKLAIYATTDSDLPQMLFTAGIFSRGGLSTEQILRMLTVNPARMLGVGNRVGNCEREQTPISPCSPDSPLQWVHVLWQRT